MEFKNLKKAFQVKINILAFVLVISSLLIGQNAFADGDGTGGGKSEPLMLVSSSIQNGATGVSLKPEIKLTFSKNIVNMSVRENNLKCFSLQTASGTAVPIDIILADDQIDFEKRNDAVIVPKSNFAQGTTYSVVVSPSLTAKSGVTTGQVIKITFTTEGTQPAPAAPATNNNTAPKTQTSAPKQQAASTTQTTTKNITPEAASNTSNTSKDEVKPTSEQSQTTTDSQKQSTDESTVSNDTDKKFIPYKAVKTSTSKNEIPKKQSSSRSMIGWIVSSLIVIVAAGFSYLFIKKRQRGSHSM